MSRHVTSFPPSTTSLASLTLPISPSVCLLFFSCVFCFVSFFCQVLSKHIWSKILLQLCIGEWVWVRQVRLHLIQTRQWGKRNPDFGVTLMVPQIQVRVSRCFCPFFPQQWCYSGVRSHPSLLGQSRLIWLRLLSRGTGEENVMKAKPHW